MIVYLIWEKTQKRQSWVALPGTKQVSPIIYLIENGHKLSLEILIASGKKKKLVIVQ